MTRTLDKPTLKALKYDVRILDRVDAENDERILESSKFLSDDDFVKSKEFISMLYNYRGNMLR